MYETYVAIGLLILLIVLVIVLLSRDSRRVVQIRDDKGKVDVVPQILQMCDQIKQRTRPVEQSVA